MRLRTLIATLLVFCLTSAWAQEPTPAPVITPEMLVPKTGMNWFEELPTSFKAARPTSAYVFARKSEQGTIFLEFVGRQITRDMSGNGKLSW